MIAIEKTLHTSRVRTTGGRRGHARSDDGRLDVQLSPPGAPGAGTNPEQLFGAAWSACFIGTLKQAANAYKVDLPDEVVIITEVDLGHGEKGFLLRVRLNVSLPDMDAAMAQQLVEAAHRSCPYSKATRGNVDVTIKLV